MHALATPVALLTKVYALGGIGQKKHKLFKVVPHASIDTDAYWVNSEYHG
ncbi:hypothetical protein GCM10027592_03450 [Spirosoma flavus]